MGIVSKGNPRDCYTKKKLEKNYRDGGNWRHPSEEYLPSVTADNFATAYEASLQISSGYCIYLIFKYNIASLHMITEDLFEVYKASNI